MHMLRTSCYRFVILTILFVSQPAWSAVVGSTQNAGFACFLHDTPARISRYDMTARQWMPDIVLPAARGTATAFLVDSDGIYVSYGASVYRYNSTGGAETFLVTTPQAVQAIHSDGNLLFINYSSGLYSRFVSLNKTTNSQIATFEQYIESVFGSAIAVSGNKIFGRTQGISPADISFVSYTDAGTFTAGGQSPYHGAYPSANKTWVFPNDAKVVDDSGTVYSAGDLSYAGTFGGTITDLTFYGTDVPIVLRNNQLSSFTSTLLPAGGKSLAYAPFRIFTTSTDVLTFTVDASEASGIKARAEPLADLAAPTPGLPVNPVGLPFTPDLVFQDVNGIICLFHKNTQSIFRWNPATQQYLATIPLIGIPSFAAYSPSLHRVYLAYPSGLVRKIDLNDPTLTESPFYALPSAPRGLAVAGDYLFAVDASGSWDTHYTIGQNGALVDSVDWNYYSLGYTWSETNQKMYFFRDDTSPNDILWEEINANGTAYPGEVKGGIRNKMDSPYHGEDAFIHPIRVAPSGSVVITGTGKIYDALTLVRQTSVLPNTITDASWIGNELRTIRTITNVTQYQQWTGSSYAPGLVKQYPGTAHRLLTNGTSQHVGISIAADGTPSLYLLDSSFEIVAPSSLAKPVNLATTAVSATQVAIKWLDVSGETSYTVERKTGSGGSWAEAGSTTVSATTFTDVNVTVGNTYFYRVTAVNGGLLSPTSDELAVPVTVPAVPSPLNASPDSSSAITLTWPNVDFESGYKLERGTSATGPWTQIATPAADVVTFQATGLTQNTTYFFRIRATNAIGDSAYGGLVSATTLLAPPGSPSLFYVTSNNYYQVGLTWTDVSFEDSYVLERAPTISGAWTQLTTLPANTVSFSDTSVAASTLYYYRIKAVNSAGDSAYYVISNTTPAPSPPSTPSGVGLRVVSGSLLRITWGNVLNETGYIIERRGDDPLSWQQVGSVAANVLVFDDSTVETGLQYWYRVKSMNAVGPSAASAEVTGTPVDLACIAQDDFDPGLDSSVWASVTSGAATNGGAGFLGSNALWFGSTGTRAATTVPLNITQTGYLEFKLRAGNQTVDGLTYWNNSETGETLVMEYSLDGSTWTTFQSINTVFPNYSSWTSLFIQVPQAAVSSATRFRWRQLANSGGTNDTWALEDLLIYSGLPPAPSPPPSSLPVQIPPPTLPFHGQQQLGAPPTSSSAL
jgi:fibronectin type 3 domain-containing protein